MNKLKDICPKITGNLRDNISSTDLHSITIKKWKTLWKKFRKNSVSYNENHHSELNSVGPKSIPYFYKIL